MIPNWNKFNSFADLWFWYCSVKNKKTWRNSDYDLNLIDVEMLITNLYLQKKLNDKQLMALKEFGDKGEAPNPNIWSYKRKADLWTAAIAVIEPVARAKGLIL